PHYDRVIIGIRHPDAYTLSLHDALPILMGRKKGIPGLSFSWKRATGLSAAKSKISRQTGIPLTRAGRQRKLGKVMGCCVPAALLLTGSITTVLGVAKAVSSFVA